MLTCRSYNGGALLFRHWKNQRSIRMFSIRFPFTILWLSFFQEKVFVCEAISFGLIWCYVDKSKVKLVLLDREACAECTLSIKHNSFKECFRYFAVFLFWSTRRRGSQKQSKSSKFLNFVVNCSIIDAKLIFVTPTYAVVSDPFRKVHTFSFFCWLQYCWCYIVVSIEIGAGF